MFNFKNILFGGDGETAKLAVTARNRAQEREERLVQVCMNLTLDVPKNTNVVQLLRDCDIEVVLPDEARILRAELSRVELRK